ncbi:MAG TPA: Uma2 family endonuclease [Tepidisphaeraceae bacterium]|nr:Uma2 family endonuclease [Tepidisphaeraceae bacterium]
MSQVNSPAAVTTADDYRRMPEGPPWYQLIQGTLYMSPSPNRFHQQVVGNIYYALRNYLADHPLGEVYVAPLDVYLTDTDVYQPDVAFVRRENSRVLVYEGFVGAPDLIVEVLSPSNSKLDLGPKRAVYARFGVKEMWVADPVKSTLSVYRFSEDAEKPAATAAVGDIVSTTLIPGFSLGVADVFRQ